MRLQKEENSRNSKSGKIKIQKKGKLFLCIGRAYLMWKLNLHSDCKRHPQTQTGINFSDFRYLQQILLPL